MAFCKIRHALIAITVQRPQDSHACIKVGHALVIRTDKAKHSCLAAALSNIWAAPDGKFSSLQAS